MQKHISESDRTTGVYTYWRTDDPNIIVRQCTSEDEIHIDKLNARIEELENLPLLDILAAEDADELELEIIAKRNQVMADNRERILALPALKDLKAIIEG